MNKKLLAVAVLAFASSAHAQSFFQIEAGLGGAHVQDVGDGTWQQWGAPNNKTHLNTPVALIGFTGQIYEHRAFDVRYHVNYVYIGEYSASCDCTEHDEDYDLKAHRMVSKTAKLGYYSGHGHLNGLAATLDAGYTYRGFRLGIEGGLWAYRQSWNQYAHTSWGDYNLQSPKSIGYAPVVGARIEHGNASLSYRFYKVRQDWSNGVPGLASGVHSLTANYRFF